MGVFGDKERFKEQVKEKVKEKIKEKVKEGVGFQAIIIRLISSKSSKCSADTDKMPNRVGANNRSIEILGQLANEINEIATFEPTDKVSLEDKIKEIENRGL